MKQISWNTHWFFRLHSLSRKSAVLDAIILFFAHGMIYAIAIFSAAYLFATLSWQRFLYAVIFGAIASFCAYTVSFAIGFVLKKERPYRAFPVIQPLFETVDGWKTFPSDHTVGSILAVSVLFVFGAPVFLCAILFLLALLVGVSRVCAGVHFPADVIAGWALGISVVIFLIFALERIGILLYDGGYFFLI